MGTTIVVHSYTGGVGKTTFGLNLALALARAGKRVVVLDLDLESPKAHTFLEREYKEYVPLSAALFQDLPLDSSLIDLSEDKGLTTGKLWVGMSSSSATSIIQASRRTSRHFSDDATKLFHWLSHLKSNPYSADFIIILASTGINQSSINCVAASDTTIIVLRPTVVDIIGVSEMINGMHKKLGCDIKLLINLTLGGERDENLKDSIVSMIREKTQMNDLEVIGQIPVEVKILRQEVELVKDGRIHSGRGFHIDQFPDSGMTNSISEIVKAML